MPLTDKGFRDQKLRIVEMRRRFAASAPDLALPEAATCSFTLTLPKYSTFQVMRRQLLIAIENCTDYDLDGAGNPATFTTIFPPATIISYESLEYSTNVNP